MELHHIYGRISGSALNSAPLCKGCHAHIKHTREEHHMLLRKTINFLSSQGYKLTEVDHMFLDLIKDDLRWFNL